MKISGSFAIRKRDKLRGLITKRGYKAGEVVIPIISESISTKPTMYTVQIDRTRHTKVKELAFMNHSCNPNTILDTTRLLVFATHDVATGEELTYFYPSTEWEMSVPFICLCGEPNCIHVVAGARFLSLSSLEHHYVNRHIREEMIEFLNNTERHLICPL